MDSFTESLTESFTPRSLGEWKGMEWKGMEEKPRSGFHQIVTYVTRAPGDDVVSAPRLIEHLDFDPEVQCDTAHDDGRCPQSGKSETRDDHFGIIEVLR